MWLDIVSVEQCPISLNLNWMQRNSLSKSLCIPNQITHIYMYILTNIHSMVHVYCFAINHLVSGSQQLHVADSQYIYIYYIYIYIIIANWRLHITVMSHERLHSKFPEVDCLFSNVPKVKSKKISHLAIYWGYYIGHWWVPLIKDQL